MRVVASALTVLTMALGSGVARGADPPTLAQHATAIEQASRAPDGERVVVGHLSRALRLPAETLRAQRAQTGLGWGELLIADHLAREAGLALDAVVAEFRSGKSWEQIARDHTVNLDKLRKTVQWSQEMVEQRAEDKNPQRIQLEGPSKPVPPPTLPSLGPLPDKHR